MHTVVLRAQGAEGDDAPRDRTGRNGRGVREKKRVSERRRREGGKKKQLKEFGAFPYYYVRVSARNAAVESRRINQPTRIPAGLHVPPSDPQRTPSRELVEFGFLYVHREFNESKNYFLSSCVPLVDVRTRLIDRFPENSTYLRTSTQTRAVQYLYVRIKKRA